MDHHGIVGVFLPERVDVLYEVDENTQIVGYSMVRPAHVLEVVHCPCPVHRYQPVDEVPVRLVALLHLHTDFNLSSTALPVGLAVSTEHYYSRDSLVRDHLPKVVDCRRHGGLGCDELGLWHCRVGHIGRIDVVGMLGSAIVGM